MHIRYTDPTFFHLSRFFSHNLISQKQLLITRKKRGKVSFQHTKNTEPNGPLKNGTRINKTERSFSIKGYKRTLTNDSMSKTLNKTTILHFVVLDLSQNKSSIWIISITCFESGQIWHRLEDSFVVKSPRYQKHNI